MCSLSWRERTGSSCIPAPRVPMSSVQAMGKGEGEEMVLVSHGQQEVKKGASGGAQHPKPHLDCCLRATAFQLQLGSGFQCPGCLKQTLFSVLVVF